MTMEEKSRRPERLLRALLPWAVAVAALALYLCTLQPWLSLDSLTVVSAVAGWDWQPPLTQPVLVTVTLPLHWLPDRMLPLALNIFSAVCAALTLAMLVRSVTLLPRDRVPFFRQSYLTTPTFMPLPWIPPLLAAAGCGLQLTFWEHSIAATGEMLTLLMFAYIIRCVLEFRKGNRDAWLYKAALVAGLAVTNDWAMLAFLPVFMIALIWVKGIAFFNQQFLVRVSLLGLAGLSFYLLPPLITALTPDSPVTVWKAIKHNPGSQFGILRFLVSSIYNANRDTALLLSLVSLFPLFFMSLRWQSFSGGTMMAGAWLVTLPFHIAHALFLGVCAWVFFDPPFSPRLGGRALGGFMPYLTLYYLAALSLGYYCGYFLQRLGQTEPANTDSDYQAPTRNPWGPLVRGAALVLLVVFPALLLLKNLPVIRNSRTSDFRRFALAVTESLPPTGAVLLSDDPMRLGFVRAALVEQGKEEAYAPVDTRLINDPDYLRFLSRRYPKSWGAAPPAGTRKLDPVPVLRILREAAQKSTICYLHPSFGYFFEAFYAEPKGVISILRPYPTNTLTLPPFSAQVLQASAAAWQGLETSVLEPLATRMDRSESPVHDFRWQVLKALKSRAEPEVGLWLASAWYSRALNDWGVDLQRSGKFPEAGSAFRRARDLKGDNLSAIVNLYCNTNLIAGNRMGVDTTRSPEAALGRYRSWEQVVNENGTFDAPEFCLALGQLFFSGNLYRQAAEEFQRITDLVPDFAYSRIMLANIDATLGRNKEALARVKTIRSSNLTTNLTPTGRFELDLVEASAWLGESQDERAAQTLSSVRSANPTNLVVLERIFALYANKQRYSNALEIVNYQLRLVPDSAEYLVNQGYVWLQLGRFTNAIVPLTQALTVETNNVQARFNRAIAYLNAGQLAEAREDYLALEELAPDVPQIQYGLGDVAWQQHQTNEAILRFSNYLSNAAPDTVEARLVEDRMKQLQQGRK